MPTWIIEPRDPLIARDGKPFGPIPGARAASLNFPFPSTIAGGVRTRLGLTPDGVFDKSLIPRLKNAAIRGPLLVELDESGEIDKSNWLCPAPMDAVLFEGEQTDRSVCYRKRLVPLKLPTGASTNLNTDLAPVGLPRPDPRKPHGDAPRFWYWDHFLKWLLTASSVPDAQGEALTPRSIGHNGVTPESRTHVGIQPSIRSAIEGALFQTRGLEFTVAEASSGSEGNVRKRLALTIMIDSEDGLSMKESLSPLGGERRLVHWRESNVPFADCPETLISSILLHNSCRLVLITPAHFEQGWCPRWLVEPRDGVIASLAAIAVGRPEVVSGWDMESGTPKPTRRLAPAGTTMFLRLKGESTAIKDWIRAIWMNSISDDESHRRDGFGLSVLGVWDGALHSME